MKKILLTLMLGLAIVNLAQAQNKSKKSSPSMYSISTKSSQSNIMENQATQVVTRFLTAVQTGDTQTLGALLHPHVEWDQPGNNRFSGKKKTSAEVFQMVGGMFELSANTLRLTDIKVVTANGNSVACLIHWNAAQPVGTILNVDNIDVYTVENGKIVAAKIYSQDLAQEDVFWGK